jgi:hypothetical protein
MVGPLHRPRVHLVGGAILGLRNDAARCFVLTPKAARYHPGRSRLPRSKAHRNIYAGLITLRTRTTNAVVSKAAVVRQPSRKPYIRSVTVPSFCGWLTVLVQSPTGSCRAHSCRCCLSGRCLEWAQASGPCRLGNWETMTSSAHRRRSRARRNCGRPYSWGLSSAVSCPTMPDILALACDSMLRRYCGGELQSL